MTTEERDERREKLLGDLRNAVDEMGWRSLRSAERMLAPYQLTFMQAFVLTILDGMGPELEMSQIAANTQLPASTITSVMDRLEKRGLVSRAHRPDDRRRITGSLTSDGKRIIDEITERRHAFGYQVLSNLTTNEIAVIKEAVDLWNRLSDEAAHDEHPNREAAG